MKNKAIIIGLVTIFIFMNLAVPSYTLEETKTLIVGEVVSLKAKLQNKSEFEIDQDVLWCLSKPSIIEVNNENIKALEIGEEDITRNRAEIYRSKRSTELIQPHELSD